MKSDACDLCDLPLPRHPPSLTTDSGELFFCCTGCRHVYQLLAESGIADGDFKQSELYRRSIQMGLIGNPGKGEAVEETPEIDLEGTKELDLHIDGMWCTSCSWLIEKVVGSENGVVKAQVTFASDVAKIRYCPEKVSPAHISKTIGALGYTTTVGSEISDEQTSERNMLLVRMGLALFLLMNVMFFSYVLYVGYFQELSSQIRGVVPVILFLLATPAVFWCGIPIHRRAFFSLKKGAPTMEVLISLSVFSAYVYSLYAWFRGSDHLYFDTATGLVALLLIGKYIEFAGRQKTLQDIKRLYHMFPKKVRRKTAAGERLVTIESLEVGDRFIVKSGEKIPTDGLIITGTSSVDESLITGESKPIEKQVGDSVTGSSMNISGIIEVEAVRVGDQTVLSAIVHMVERALQVKSPIERLVDRISKVFIPAVLTISACTGIYLLLSGAGLEPSLVRSITVLVIACPCALGMATPLAIAAGIGYAAKRGILVRDAAILQHAGKIGTMVFDKTGTLTTGQFALLDIEFEGNEDKALVMLGSLERSSNHPLAYAVIRACEDRKLPFQDVSMVQIVEGMGIAGIVGSARPDNEINVIIGNNEFLNGKGLVIPPEERRMAERQAEAGRTIVYFGIRELSDATRIKNNEHDPDESGWRTGFITFGDSLKPEAADVVRELKGYGISLQLLSGDSQRTTAAIAQQAEIDDYRADARPEDKIKIIRNLQSSGAVVSMVGDGVNDAPALAQSDIGIAMSRGTEIAAHSASINLMRDNLRLIPEVIALSRRTVHIISQNLGWAFLYNVLGIFLAVTGRLNPLIAAGAMLISSLSVVGNSMRLRHGKGQTAKKILEILIPWREP